ncbi:MAG: hypothetical protein IID45_13510, partial [Planctomycetes bacterium]|nr:hypothetical protein [Planctomycetota bacterium]
KSDAAPAQNKKPKNVKPEPTNTPTKKKSAVNSAAKPKKSETSPKKPAAIPKKTTPTAKPKTKPAPS